MSGVGPELNAIFPSSDYTDGRMRHLVLFASLLGALVACAPERESTPETVVRSDEAAAQDTVDAFRLVVRDTTRICPVVPFVDDGTGLEFSESDVTFEAFEEGTRYFISVLPRQLNDPTFLRPGFNETEFWIGLTSSTLSVRGYALRLAALAERMQRLPDTVSLADTSTARSRFCAFLRGARMPD